MPGHDRQSGDDTPPLSSEELLQRARDGLFDNDPADQGIANDDPIEPVFEEKRHHEETDAGDMDDLDGPIQPVFEQGRGSENTAADDPDDPDGPIQPVFEEGARRYDDDDDIATMDIPADVFGMPLPPEPERTFEPDAPQDRPPTVTDRMATPPGAPPAPSVWSRIWATRGILVGLIVLGIVVFNFFDSSTDVESLLIGDCFDEPSGEEFSSVDVVDCAEPHDYEVLATVDIPGETYPGDFDVFIEAFEECEFFFTSYVGTDYASSEIYLAPFVPTESSWDAGDREAICAIYLPTADGEGVARTTGSLQGSGR